MMKENFLKLVTRNKPQIQEIQNWINKKTFSLETAYSNFKKTQREDRE